MTDNHEYDAILVISFGGPEGPDDVMPFLRNVVRGRNVPEERLREVAHHYDLFGGISPINEQTRKLIAALNDELHRSGIKLPVYWGNRNWHPMLENTVSEMVADGIKSALAIATAGYSSYSSCRQYLQDIDRARAAAGPDAPRIEKIKPFYNRAGFIDANFDRLRDALSRIDAAPEDVHVAFTAHSIPVSMANGCLYRAQLQGLASRLAERASISDWQLVFQSRSGPPSIPWLEPDINDHLKEIHKSGKKHVVISPIGFVSDHMEVIYDLDVEAAQLCSELGIKLARAETVGVHPSFIGMLRGIIEQHLNPSSPQTKGIDSSYCFDEKVEAEFCHDGCCPLSVDQERMRERPTDRAGTH